MGSFRTLPTHPSFVSSPDKAYREYGQQFLKLLFW